MLTLETSVRIPDWVLFAVVDEEAVLLNTRTNQYYALDDVGARFWSLINERKQLREAYQTILGEYEVDSARLERDILELANDLVVHGLVETPPG